MVRTNLVHWMLGDVPPHGCQRAAARDQCGRTCRTGRMRRARVRARTFRATACNRLLGGERPPWRPSLLAHTVPPLLPLRPWRDVLQECGHITTTYFDAHATNYYATVLKEVMQYDDAWWRYEFAKSRGAIHSHSLVSSRMHRAMTEAAQRCGWSDWAAERARQPPELDDEDEDAADEARRDDAAQHLACFLCDETAYAPEAEDLRDHEAIVSEATRPQPHADLNLSAPSLRCRLTEQDGAPVGPGFVSLHPAGTTTPGVPDTSRWAPPEGSEPEAGQPGGPCIHLLRNRLDHALAAGSAGVHEFHRNLCNRLLLHGCSSGYCLSKKKDKASKKKCAAAPLALTPEPKATAGG